MSDPPDPRDEPDPSEQPDRATLPIAGAAFLLAQLGAHAGGRYAARVAGLDLNPGHTGLLRMVALAPGMNQQTLAAKLGVTPSKIVALVDELAARGLVERRRSQSDRRATALHLTAVGTDLIGQIRAVARDHEYEITAALDQTERAQLIDLLQRVADQQGLIRGVHPGYRAGRG